ncbi:MULTISPECIES: hypothetical protein [unclassified Proteiniphilum]|jgi:hypothetical protein|uniref:hypothetical protein n=1 Tax=unclassified Proteiniphilum TaxID=2622718 RepID=UPI00257C0ED1|nr:MULTISPECIES: hypothetical protein [unclassified Proteiniphilum]MDD4778838.1 hypothetical protein [Fermentimonas sp.]
MKVIRKMNSGYFTCIADGTAILPGAGTVADRGLYKSGYFLVKHKAKEFDLCSNLNHSNYGNRNNQTPGKVQLV